MITDDEVKGLNSIRQAVDQILYVNSTIKKKRKSKVDKERDAFINVINSIELLKTRSFIVSNDLDLDFTAYNDKFYDIIDKLIYMKYGDACADIIMFYIWDRVNIVDGTIAPFYNDAGDEVYLHTPLDLWAYILKINPKLESK